MSHFPQQPTKIKVVISPDDTRLINTMFTPQPTSTRYSGTSHTLYVDIYEYDRAAIGFFIEALNRERKKDSRLSIIAPGVNGLADVYLTYTLDDLAEDHQSYANGLADTVRSVADQLMRSAHTQNELSLQ